MGATREGWCTVHREPQQETHFASERQVPLGAHDEAAFRDLAMRLRAASWDIALGVVQTALDRDLLPSLRPLGTIKQLANLPAFIGGLAMAIIRPAPGPRRGTNPILARLARDHVIEREQAGFTAREIVQEFLLLRRVMWRFIQQEVDPSLGAGAVLRLEDLINSILDEVIAECTVIYFDRATQELSERSRRDSLTGLLNHQAFNTRLDEEIDRATRYGNELQVIYFDMDAFKQINDVQGHTEGDRALRVTAQCVLESIRDSDFAGRIGGDEFVIGLVESTDMAAHLLLDRLRERIAIAVAEGRAPSGTAVSAGCAGYPTEADCAQDLLVLADRRLYDDKRARKLAERTHLPTAPTMDELIGPHEAAPEDAAGAVGAAAPAQVAAAVPAAIEQAQATAVVIEEPPYEVVDLGEELVAEEVFEAFEETLVATHEDIAAIPPGPAPDWDHGFVPDDGLGADADSDSITGGGALDPETARMLDEAQRAIDEARRRADE